MADSCWQKTILDSVADGVFVVDEQFRIISFNRAAEQITGWAQADALGRPCHEVFRANICKAGCALRRSLASGEPIVNAPIEILDRTGRRLPISVSTAPLTGPGPDGQIACGVETFRDLSMIEELRRAVASGGVGTEIVGRHPRIQRILDVLPVVAESDASVLLLGASGSGKSQLARAIHERSPRRQGPFVQISCASLPETLLESELFGYVKGAFTGAARDKPGRIALADRGTLFLDEIGDAPLSVQVKLLRVLQEREYEPLGATHTERADVRILAATHVDLGAAIRAGRFRQDLYYRLNVVTLDLPGLAERREDIPLLVDRFVTHRSAITGKSLVVAPEAMALLLRHDYPGNVRELENAIEHAFVLCAHGEIRPEHLPLSLAGTRAVAEAASAPALDRRELAEADVIRRVLEEAGGNRLEAARRLGMHRSTLWRKLRAYGLA